MALKEFKLPDIGEGIAEGEIVSWKVKASPPRPTSGAMNAG